MYCEFFGLRCRPFEDRADTRFFYATSDAEEAVAALEYEAHGGKGMALVTGDAGTGKTLLVRTLLQRLHATDHVVVVTCSSNGALDASREVCKGFGLTLPSSPSDVRYLARLRKHLIRTAEADHRSVLILDQAENLTDENMQQIAALQELQRDGRHLLSILLVGQPQVRGFLDQPRFARIRQQFFGEKKLTPLNASETAAYIAHRLHVAGLGDTELFSDDALRLVHEAAQGIPRLINHVCEAALVAAYGAGEKWINVDVVSEVTGGAARPARSIDVEEAGLSKDRRSADAWTGFPPEPPPKPSTGAPHAIARDDDFSATETMLPDDGLRVAPQEIGDYDGPGLDGADDIMSSGGYMDTTVSVRTEAMCSRLERTLDRAERVNATTQASLNQFAALEKHLSTLAAHSERLIAGLNGAAQRHKESAELTQRRVDHTFAQAETRAKSLETGADRMVRLIDDAEQQTDRIERATTRGMETQTQLTAFAERLADKVDEVQERMSVLMAGLESAKTAGCGLTEAITKAVTATADADRSAERLTEKVDGVKERVSTLTTGLESANTAECRLKEVTTKAAAASAEADRIAARLVAKVDEVPERMSALSAGLESAKAAECGLNEATTKAATATVDADRSTECLRAVAKEVESTGRAFQAACGDAAVEHATERLQKEIDTQLRTQTERIERAIEKELGRFVQARARLATATKQSQDGVDALEHAARDITQRAAAGMDELKSSTEAIEQRRQRAEENLRTITDGVTGVDARLTELRPIVERFTSEVEGLVEQANGSRTDLAAVVSRSDKLVASVQAASGEAEAIQRGVAATLVEIGGAAERVNALREEYNRCEQATERLNASRAVEKRTAEQLEAVVGQGASLREDLDGLLAAARDHAATVRDTTDAAVAADERLGKTVRQSETVRERAIDAGRDAQQSAKAARDVVERLAIAQAAGAAVSTALADTLASAGQFRDAIRSEVAHADKTLTGIQAEATTASEVLGDLTRANEKAEQVVDQAAAARAAACEALDKTTQGVRRIEALRQESDTVLARLEPAVGEAKRLSLSFDALLVAADDKVTRLNSHHAAASQALTRLAETQKQAQAVALRIDALKHELDESTGNAKGEVDRRWQEVTALVERAEANAERLSSANATAETLIDALTEKSVPVADLADRLAATVSQAGERLDVIERRCGDAGKLAGRMSSITRILSGAKELESDIRRTTEDARIVFDSLGERTDAAGQQSALLEEVSGAARCVIETCEQVKAEAARTSERLGVQTSSANRAFDEREPLIAAFAEQTQTIEAVLSDLQTRAGTIQKQVDELAAKPQELLAGAQAQAAQLEGVCAAVRKVFSAVSQTSLEARQQTLDFRKASDEATTRLNQLTTETDRAANTLAQWVDEAVRVQSRLERAIKKSPTIHETHPPEGLASASRILSPSARIAELGKGQRMELSEPPGETQSGKVLNPPRPAKATGRADQISQLIEEAKQAAVQTPG